MQYDETPDDVEVMEDGAPPIEERLTALRAKPNAAGYSAQARARIEYLQELRRLRSQIGDDGFDSF